VFDRSGLVHLGLEAGVRRSHHSRQDDGKVWTAVGSLGRSGGGRPKNLERPCLPYPCGSSLRGFAGLSCGRRRWDWL